MPSHALDQRLFEKTNSLTDEQGQISASAADGVELIDGWLRVIAGNTSTQLIEEKLKQLRDQLTLDQPDSWPAVRPCRQHRAGGAEQKYPGANRK